MDFLTESPTLDVFNDQAVALLQTLWDSSISRQFSAHFTAKVLPLLKANYVAERSVRTNNNCEIGNYILKTVIDWKPQSVTPLVKRLKATIKAQTKELEGHCMVEATTYSPPDMKSTDYQNMDGSVKIRSAWEVLLKIFKIVPSSVPTVLSQDCALKVMNVPLAMKKPNQLKRKHTAWTSTVTFQKVWTAKTDSADAVALQD